MVAVLSVAVAVVVVVVVGMFVAEIEMVVMLHL
jgi:hypothetical protein